MKRGIRKHKFGLSLFRPSRQSNISTSGEERFKYPLPWKNKISQMGRANKDNQIPTPCPASLPSAGFTLIGALSIDNETDDDDASQPRQTGPRVSFLVGKTKFRQCSFPDRRRLFLCKELCLITVLLWHSKTSVIYIL